MRAIWLLALAGMAAWTPAAPAQTVTSAAEERIADLVRVWYSARLFHPDLAASPAAWEAALVAAVEPALAAADDQAFAAVVNTMLAGAGDSSAVAPGPPPAAPPGAEPVPALRIVDGAAVADCTALAAARIKGDMLNEAMAAVMPAAKAKGMVIDCRHFAPETDWQKRYAQWQGASEWLRMLVGALGEQPLVAGSSRVRFHDGYPTERGWSSGGYQNGTADIAIAPFGGKPATVRPRLTFLFDASTPHDAAPIAGAVQAAGLGRVVTEGPGLSSTRYPIYLRHVQAWILGGRYVYPDGRVGFRPDACDAGAEALARAIALLDPAAAAPGCAQAARPVLPAAAPAGEAASKGQRVLALAKLWGAIEYFYPFKALLDRPWSAQLDRFAGHFLAADTRAAYEDALQRLAREIDDSHVAVHGLASDANRLAPPLYIRPVGKGFAVAAIHDAAGAPGVAIGDELVSVDGRPFAEIAAGRREVTAASTPQALAASVAGYLTSGPKGSSVRLELRRGARSFEVTLARSLEAWTASGEPADNSPAWRRIEPGIGYIDLQRLAFGDADKALDELLDTRALIFDLRGYPQGTAWAIAPRLAPDDATRVGALFRRPTYRGPAEPGATWTSFEQPVPRTAKPRYRGRVVVLIDDRAISQSEHSALLFKAATTPLFVGTPTTGANGDVTVIALPGNLWIGFTGHSVRHPDGREVQRVGIQPDIAVAPTLAGMRAGRDEVLEAGLKVAKKR